MATRRPLVIVNGVVQEIAVADDLPADCIPGGGGGGGTDINGMAFTDAGTSTVTSGLVNYNAAARVYTFPDRSMTVAGVDEILSKHDGSRVNMTNYATGNETSTIQHLNTSPRVYNLMNLDGHLAMMDSYRLILPDQASGAARSNYLEAHTSTSRSWVFPDKNGTVATTDDIPTIPVMGYYYITIGITEDQSNHTGEVVLEPEKGMTEWSFLMVQLAETPENGDDEIRECTLFATPGNNKFTYYLSSDGPIFGQFLITYCFYTTPPG